MELYSDLIVMLNGTFVLLEMAVGGKLGWRLIRRFPLKWRSELMFHVFQSAVPRQRRKEGHCIGVWLYVVCVLWRSF
jgi:hypothetical protein